MKYAKYPSCINCTNYIAPVDYNIYGDCRLFVSKNMVAGSMTYEKAYVCRIKESKCGINGKYFDEYS